MQPSVSICLKLLNGWAISVLHVASIHSPPIFLNYYLLKSIFHPGCSGSRPAAFLVLNVGNHFVSLSYTSQDWTFSFSSMAPSSSCGSFVLCLWRTLDPQMQSMTNPKNCQNKCYFHFVLFFFFLLSYGICIACCNLCAFCLPSFHSIFSLHFILGYFHEMSSKPVNFMSSKLKRLSRVVFTSATMGFQYFLQISSFSSHLSVNTILWYFHRCPQYINYSFNQLFQHAH